MLDEVRLAIIAYWRWMRRQGYEDCQINQPSRSSRVIDDRVILENGNGYLATYHLDSKRITESDEDAWIVEHW